MNNKQKTRKSWINFIRTSGNHSTAARTALFRATNLGTKFLSDDQVATLLTQYDVSISAARKIEEAMV